MLIERLECTIPLGSSSLKERRWGGGWPQSTLTLSSAQHEGASVCPGTTHTHACTVCVCVCAYTQQERDIRFKDRTVYTSICLNANGLPVLQHLDLLCRRSKTPLRLMLYVHLSLVHIVNASCLERRRWSRPRCPRLEDLDWLAQLQS